MSSGENFGFGLKFIFGQKGSVQWAFFVQRTWQDAWSFSAHARCRQLSSQILAKLFSFINIFGVDSRLGDDPQLFCVLRDL